MKLHRPKPNRCKCGHAYVDHFGIDKPMGGEPGGCWFPKGDRFCLCRRYRPRGDTGAWRVA